MPPKLKFTKEQIVAAGLEITRKHGIAGLTARALAAELGSSVKPIFGLFASMEDVQRAVLGAANALYQSYLQEDMSSGIYPPYKASGMAYIRFAREEKELFKLLFMRDRTQEEAEKAEDAIESLRPIINIIQKNLGISEAEALYFHRAMWIYAHGIASMIATSYLDWELDFISKAMTDVYEGFKLRFMKEREKCSQ